MRHCTSCFRFSRGLTDVLLALRAQLRRPHLQPRARQPPNRHVLRSVAVRTCRHRTADVVARPCQRIGPLRSVHHRRQRRRPSVRPRSHPEHRAWWTDSNSVGVSTVCSFTNARRPTENQALEHLIMSALTKTLCVRKSMRFAHMNLCDYVVVNTADMVTGVVNFTMFLSGGRIGRRQ
jgi:hypothetical protein